MRRFYGLALLLGSQLVLAAEVPSGGPGGEPGKIPIPVGTRISAEKVARPFWHKSISYDWAVRKDAEKDNYTITPGSTIEIKFKIQVVRTVAETINEVKGVRGEVCVQNHGDVRTEDLRIIDRIQVWSGSDWENVPGASQSIARGEVGPHSERCFDYRFSGLDLEPGQRYRNRAHVTIRNFEGYLGSSHGVTVYDRFTLPEAPVTREEIDENAVLTDIVEACPSPFNCTVPPLNDLLGIPFAEIPVTMSVTLPVGEVCEDGQVTNKAIVTEQDSQTERTASDTVSLNCTKPSPTPTTSSSPSPGPSTSPSTSPTPPGGGCTRTIGYWKTHAGFGPQDDEVTQYLPITLGNGGGDTVNVPNAATAVALLDNSFCSDGASNGIGRLYAQLLGALLNQAAGADTTTISTTLTDSENFLTNNGCSDWAGLSAADKAQVNAWQATLDQYNNGVIGPGHCRLGAVSRLPQATDADLSWQAFLKRLFGW